MSLPISRGVFVLAGLCEIGGGYLVWLWIREERPFACGIAGATPLFLYSIIPTLEPAHFGRIYAAYGGMFIVLSLLLGRGIDRVQPDCYDTIGVILCLGGMMVIMYAPRT
jgi:small multidrug resistance family-3 protein